jgi:polar amino acid transport system permease protein
MLITLVTFLLKGLLVTLQIFLIALPMGFLLGISLALVRVYGNPWFSKFAVVYSTVMRAVPALVMLFIIYFVITGAIDLPAFWAGSLSLGIVTSANQMEVFRGAIQSVGPEQMRAARAIGMTKGKAIRYIILPQALRLAIPPWSNEVAIVLKDTSLIYAIGVPEMLRQAEYFSASTYQPFLAFGACAALYFLLTFLTNRGLDALERKINITI